jgi:hypothetical protein
LYSDYWLYGVGLSNLVKDWTFITHNVIFM